ncbi:hypothetical protein [Kushneria phosphatilytica]|uniref:Uncharacterized protein n=1 Tax=Kushneria phosphatilytica TaxID=657387 RepID=A0A1S1NSW2_9GAMM|nr:hypothetical protein [Kushneria phosphatilytica]OHV09700.1 hypothetical protein BH688_10685 [Kushneria phosphatilytica]QEL11747.1 hypothetical protein FY550_11750 [Kushneria phosphatilytica]
MPIVQRLEDVTQTMIEDAKSAMETGPDANPGGHEHSSNPVADLGMSLKPHIDQGMSVKEVADRIGASPDLVDRCISHPIVTQLDEGSDGR